MQSTYKDSILQRKTSFNSQLASNLVDMNSIIFAFCILAKFLSAGTGELHGPSNIACLSGTKVNMTCESSEEDSFHIDWYYENHNATTSSMLASNTGNNVSTNYLMIRIENRESLVIQSVQLQDAGIYYCSTLNMTALTSVEFGGHLIVLTSNPTCEVENVTVMENDYIQLQCSVTYSGILRPVMEWTQLGLLGKEKIGDDKLSVNVATSQNYTKLTVSLRILATPYHNHINFSCRTYFDYLNNSVALLKKKVSNNTPDYNHTWTSPEIKVLYGSRNVSIYPARDTLYPGDKLTCSAMGNPEPDYKWTSNEPANIQIGSQIEIIQSMIREQPYVFRCTANNSVYESYADIMFKVQSRLTLIYIAHISMWLLCAFLLIAIGFAIRKCIKGRNERSYAVPEAREIRNEQNGHIIPDVRVGSLNNIRHGDYVDLLATEPRNEERQSIRTRAVENNTGCSGKTNSQYVGADGTEYVQLNIRADNQMPTTKPVVHHSTIEVSHYASIDHTLKAPKRRE